MSDENKTPMFDFNNLPGAISADDLGPAPEPNNTAGIDFNSTPGAISVAELEKAEAELARQPIVPIPTPQPLTPNQPTNTSGDSGFDNQGVSNFLNNYGKKKQSKPLQQEQVQQGDPLASMSKKEQASILNELIFGGDKPKKETPTKTRRPVIEEEYDDYDDYDDYDGEYDYDVEEYNDDRVVGCVCTEQCPNTNCIFYGRDNYLSINDIMEEEINDRIDYLIASGQIEDRKRTNRKQKLVKNRYLSDISDSLLDL
jgi:hypothetical protein